MKSTLSPLLLGPSLPTPREMAEWDASSISDFSIPEMMLMENAAREAFHAVKDILRPKSRILVIMGGGNNGGDGAALARHLHDAGHAVLVCHTKMLKDLNETAGEHARIAVKAGVVFSPLAFAESGLHVPFCHSDIAAKPDLVVDALIGTGYTGELRDRERAIIRYINRYHGICPIVSLDVPSGLNALSGHPTPEAVRASMTVTFEAAKTGLAFPHAEEFTGTLLVRPIGIPKTVREANPASFHLLSPSPEAWPTASAFMHKGTAGRVTIFGGSSGLAGAPSLAALGALRNGAGLVTVACPGGVEPLVRSGYPEIMTAPFGQGTSWTPEIIPDCLRLIREMPRASALVVGPGMGVDSRAKETATALVTEKKRPALVLDADGLRVLEAPKTLALLREDDCITPHPGEAARILKTTVEDIQAARVEALRALMASTKATVVLKGAGTLIGRAGFPIFIAPFATRSLAVGGSGDVLSGVIAAFLAQMRSSCPYMGYRDDAFPAAALGVFVHGTAGRALDEKYPNRGALAREIADAVSRVPRG